MPDLQLDDSDLGFLAQTDFNQALSTREDVVNRKLEHYQLYRAYRTDTSDGDAGRTDPNAIGPFNWSRLTIPFAYWVVETLLSRSSTDSPTVSVVPRTLQAVQYAEAKQLRLNQMFNDACWSDIVLTAEKDMYIWGDGFVKTVWDPERRRPKIHNVPWLDFVFSSEAVRMHDAEALFHITWHTRDSIDSLSKVKGKNGRALYRNLDQIKWQGQDRTATDTHWQDARTAAGAGTTQYNREGLTQIPIVECWYRDGSVITVAGSAYNIVIRSQPAQYHDQDGHPIRPFISFQNTPDPYSPYGISDVEMIEDMQREASLMTNQAIDQATRNLNRPVFYDRTKLSPQDIDAAYSQPGGKQGVRGTPDGAIWEAPSVELSRDYDSAIQRVQQMVAMVSGVSDTENAPPPSPNPSQMETATGTWIRAQESNRRVDYKLFLISQAVKKIACTLDWIDREYNKRASMIVPVKPGYHPGTAAKGIDIHPDSQIAVVKGAGNGKEYQYDIVVDAGTLAAPMGNEVAQKALMLAHTLMDPQLGLADLVDKSELATILVDAAGFEPQRILAPQAPQGPGGDQGPQPGGHPPDASPGSGQGAPPPSGDGGGGPAPTGPPESGPPPGGASPPPPGGPEPVSPDQIPPQELARLRAQAGAAPEGPGAGAGPQGPPAPGAGPGQIDPAMLQQMLGGGAGGPAPDSGGGQMPPQVMQIMQAIQQDPELQNLSPQQMQALIQAALSAQTQGG